MKHSYKLIIFPLISLYLLYMPQMSSSAHCCEAQYCNSSYVGFPFRVSGVQPESCGCQGFGLYCDDELGLLLELPNAGNFTVDYIYYYSRKMKILDPNECLATKLFALDLTTTPFRGEDNKSVVDYQLYNCSWNDDHFDKIDCLSGPHYTVIADSSSTTMADPNCQLMQRVSTPFNIYSDVYSSIYLTWDEPDCGSCEVPNDAEIIWKVMLGIILPGSVLLMIICYGILRLWCMTSRNESATSANATSMSSTTSSGLDQSTIDSYPMVILGDKEVGLSKPDSDMCPICLSGYSPNDTLKVLPNCLHRFHADCIDRWLKSQPTCPICRTSPSPDLANFLV